MEPIRVLQVVTTMERAGLETMLMNYYRNIDRERVQFDFLRHRDGEHAYDAEIRAMGGRIYTVPPFNPINTNGYPSALNMFFSEHRNNYRVVHAHLDCLSAIPLRFAKKYGISTRIAHAHVSRMTFDIKLPIRMFYRALLPYTATDLFACSGDAGKWMFGKRKFTVIPNAIDCSAFSYDAQNSERLRRENGLSNRLVIGHVGRFDPVKNHAFLIEVFRKIVNQRRDSILLLAGAGNTMAEIKAMVREYGLDDQVRFLGSVSNVPELLQMMDVFVFPSLYEGLGISLIEAQSTGLPCFASQNCVPDSANITGNVRFLPLDAGAEAWADAILREVGSSANRQNCTQAVRDAGYDIQTEARKLEMMYLNFHGR